MAISGTPTPYLMRKTGKWLRGLENTLKSLCGISHVYGNMQSYHLVELPASIYGFQIGEGTAYGKKERLLIYSIIPRKPKHMYR